MNISTKIILSIVSVLFLINCTVAQPTLSSDNKKAVKLYNEGKGLYDSRNNDLAEVKFLLALERDPNFAEAALLLAYVYTEKANYEQAIIYYTKSIEAKYDLFPEAHASLGALLLKVGKYEEAKKHFTNYFKFTDAPLMMKNLANDGLRDCEFAIEALKNPVPFEPKNMGKGVNSELPEYFPALSADGKTLLYTRRLNDPSTPTGFNEDFFVSYFDGHNWKTSINVKGVNSYNNEGAPTLSANGNFLIFTICADPYEGYGKGKNGFGSCDLFYSFKSGNDWSFPRNLGEPVNSRNWETQPSFSSDGKTLYFIRGFGRGQDRQQDIYMTEIQADGSWSKPTPLSKIINTASTEESVFIHPDGKTLYFSSDGHPGMGGLDIFKSTKDENGEWTTPVNLGYPINTHNDENSLLVSADGKTAYFASDREGGLGSLDLYQFELPEHARAEEVTYLSGIVYDESNNDKLAAKFELIDIETGNVVVTSFSDGATGKYLVSLPPNKEYALNVSKKGYLFYSENFKLTHGTSYDPFKKDVPLSRIQAGKEVVLKNVFFETAKFDLKPTSKAELNKLVTFLNENPNLKIELGGHTDNVGNKKDNQILSDNRAKAVKDYLVSNGIDANRLLTKGYGDTSPIADNDTEEGRAENRRTAFKVVE
jgi:outer membrane protein OmpA-like peptidoglycan-associated protein/Tol biopolymer transport system component|tara:strand:+ start:151281 stop:153233 length:1953 start_codon:yes stop_codon:yes gene_type:complete